ncbi:TonB-dependent receptor [Sphingomonas sp. RS2018]
MNSTSIFKRKALRGGSALQAIVLLGAGLTAGVFAAAPAAAQDYTNVTASGRVQGTNGQGVGAATVELKSDSQGFVRTVTTDSSGGFRIPQLPAGTYTFTITANGFDTYTESGIVLNQTSSANQFTLATTGAAGTASSDGGDIVVTAGRVQVQDFERTTTGAVIDIGELQTRVPVQRSLRDVILLAPGTTQGGSAANGAFANQAQVSGSSFTENAYYVNGLNITEFRQGFLPTPIPFDFYQTVEVKTGGFQAEFGRATGGVINAITKSGTNEYHAGVLFNWEPNFLSGDAPNSYLADNDGDFNDRIDAVFTASGPIIKDKLFFFGLYNNRYVVSENGTSSAADATNNRSTRQSTKSPFYGGKLDFVPFDGQRLELTYFNSTGESDNVVSVYNSNTNTRGRFVSRTTSLSGGENYVGRYTGTFAPWITVSGAYGVNKNRTATLPANTTLERVTDNRTGTPTELANGTGSVVTNNDKRSFYRGDVDLYFRAFGSHHIRFGYDRESLDATQLSTTIGRGASTLSTANGTDLTRLPAGTQFVSTRTFENGGTFNTTNEAFYIQDSWSLFQDRVNLQLGVRNDRFVNKDAGGVPFYKSGDQWGPRLGFTVDPFGDGSTKVFGSFGRYFVPIAANTNIRGAGRELDYTAYYRLAGLNPDSTPIYGAPILGITNSQACPGTTVANCTITADGEITDPTAFIAQGLKPQSLDEYIIGAERRIGQRWRVGLNYTNRKLGAVLEDVAIDQAVLAYCARNNITGCGGRGFFTGFHQYVLVNPGEAATIQLLPLPNGTTPTVDFTAEQLGYPKAKRSYDAVTLTVDREFDGKWSFSGSYTWSSLRGNYEGGAKSDVGQSDTGATQDFDQPGLTLGSYGFLPGHRRHTVKAYGSYQIGDFLNLGANVQIQSPKKFGCIGFVPESIDPFAAQYGAAGNFCQGKLVQRGTAFESDWRKEVSLTAELRVPSDRVNASIRFDVFNVLNSKSALDFDEFGDDDVGAINPNYRSPLVFQAPRSGRIQLRVGF